MKRPYQGYFVRQFTEQEIRELYEVRATLESLAAKLACERITEPELTWLREHQSVGETALKPPDMEAYRIYNRDLHTAILRAAKNSYLATVMGQLSLQSEMLMARTIRMVGRPSRAIKEHRKLINLIAKRDAAGAAELMERHILGALDDLLRHSKEAGRSSGAAEKAPEQ